MRFTSVFITIGLVTSAAAWENVFEKRQDISGLPSCSLNCLTSAIQQFGCGITDEICQCKTYRNNITEVATPCIQKACDKADQTSAAMAAATICEKALSSAGSSTATTTSGGSSSSTATGASATATTGAAVPMEVSGSMFAMGALGAVMLAL